MINLSEIFLSIQGESTFSGLPCIFIRFSGCNLRCSYCDSKDSYKTKFTLSPLEILQSIKKYKPIDLIEITGGEPLLQNDMYELIEILNKNNYQILLETNGSLNIQKIPDYVIKIVDIKCPGSGEAGSFLIENLKYISKDKDEIKFVLSDKMDYEWAKKKIRQYNLEDYKILFSTVFSKLSLDKLADWIISNRLQVRMQLQLHKYIWEPNKRGV